MKTKTMDDWDELADALSYALPNGVEVAFPGKPEDEDTDLRLIVDGGNNARLVIDLGDEDTARSEETFYLEWGVHDDDEGWEEADFTWQNSDWMRSGAGWTNEGDEALRWAMGDLAGDVVGAVLDMVCVLAGGERDEGQILYNEEGHVEVDDDLRMVLADAYDKGAMDLRSFIRETIVGDIDLQPEEGFADVRQSLSSDWVFDNIRSGRALSLDVDLRYPADGGSRCVINCLSARGSDTFFVKRATNAMMSPEDFETMEAAIAWLIDEDAEKEEE